MSAGLNDVLAALNKILAVLTKEFEGADVDFQIEVLTINSTAAPLYTSQKKVRHAVFQNLSSTDAITLMRGPAGKVGAVTAGAGIVLNPATSAGLGGGSVALHNIDLSAITAITATNNTQSLAVVYYF